MQNDRAEPTILSDQEIVVFVMRTCLQFGAQLHTALIVAGLFLQGVRDRA